MVFITASECKLEHLFVVETVSCHAAQGRLRIKILLPQLLPHAEIAGVCHYTQIAFLFGTLQSIIVGDPCYKYPPTGEPRRALKQPTTTSWWVCGMLFCSSTLKMLI